jgi:outer membrane protein
MFRAPLKAFTALAICAATLGLTANAAAEGKIAVIDTQRAIMETEDGLRAQATLKKLFDKRQHELDKKQTDLQKEREDIEKQQNVLSKGALQKRVEKWQREMIQLQTVFVEYNKELQKKQGELTQPIFQKAMGIIRRLATQDGYDIVLDKQAVPYVRSDLDLTDRVIQGYNAGGGGAADTKGDAKAGGTKPATGPAPAPAPALKAPTLTPKP